MANLAVTDLTFTVVKSKQQGGTRPYREVYGTILIPTSSDYAAGGVPISGITSGTTGAVVAATALACPGLGFPNELVHLTVVSNGLAASRDDASIVLFDSGVKADGTAPTAAHKLRIMKSALDAGSLAANTVDTLTAAAQTFTGSALAAHRHTLFVDDSGALDATATRLNATANSLFFDSTAAADISVAGVADVNGAGGIVDVTAGTPAGTNSTSAVTGTLTTGAFTGTASADRKLIEHTAGALNEALTVYVFAVGW